MLLRAGPPGQSSAGEPQTSSPLRQPAGSREGPSGGRRGRKAGAVVHADVFPVQREGQCDRTAACWVILTEEVSLAKMCRIPII